jgi:peptidoglycan/xylan/chitin deacetylase (PgdA/CDA1 family)
MRNVFSSLIWCCAAANACEKPLYLTFDTGHMAPAQAIKAILDKHQVKASFFVANEKTHDGGTALDERHKIYFQTLAHEGHLIASHTWQHWYFQNDVGSDKVRLMPWGRPALAKDYTQNELCTELGQPLQTLGLHSTWWRAPGGRISARYVQMAKQCGFQHVGWTRLLGDELNSDHFSNQQLLDKALQETKAGEVLLLHLGVWSRKQALWPILDPLIHGLKRHGFCFHTIAQAQALPTTGKY